MRAVRARRPRRGRRLNEEPLSRGARGSCSWDVLPGFRRGEVQRVADPDHGRRCERLRRRLCRRRIRGRLRTGAGPNLPARRNVSDGRWRTFCVPRPEGVFKDETEGLPFTNLNSDAYWTSIKDEHTIQKLLKLPYPQGPSTEGLEAVRGYAAGYDAYLKHIGGASGVTNPACKGAAWVRPIKPIDVWRRIYQVDGLSGNSALGPYAEANPAYGPPAQLAVVSARGHSARTASIARVSQSSRESGRATCSAPTGSPSAANAASRGEASCSPIRTSRGTARSASGR